MNKLKLDLPLVLPPDAAHADPCADRLLAVLRGRPGVLDAHLETKDGERHLCVHFDPAMLAPSVVEKMVHAAGAELASKFGHIHVSVRGIRHERHARVIEAALLREKGVLYAAVSFGARQVALEFNPGELTPARAREYVRHAGLEIEASPSHGHEAHGHEAHGHEAHDEHGEHKHDDHAGHKHDDHAGHDHAGHDHGAHKHDDHAGHDHGAHKHGDHAGHDHGAHKHDDHAGHDHSAHKHGDHAGHDHGDHAGHDHHGHGHGHHHGGPFGAHSELIFAVLCGVLTGVGAGCVYGGMPTVAWVLYGLAYVFGGWFLLREAVEAIRAGVFEIEFLMLVAALGAAALGEPFEGALLLFLFSLGHSLEHFAMARARQAISGLAELVPPTAVRLADGAAETVPVSALKIGDRLLVKPNTRIPADGVVVDGESCVDQAPITGESAPVDKRAHPRGAAALAETAPLDPAHRVFAGTINGAGALELLVLHVAADSTLARVVKLVTEAQTQKSPTQEFTDRFERVFVPVILGFIGLLMFAWVVVDEPFAASFYRAMAVLVAASPCALAIATPSAVLSGVGRAARGGVLIKGGAHLDALGNIGAIAFDKTGTLTEGEPKLTDVAPLPGVDAGRLLAIAAALERRSDHPLARAVVEGAGQRGAMVLEADEVVAITGFGLRGKVDGAAVLIGKPGLFTQEPGGVPEAVHALATGLLDQGRTVMLVRHGGQFLGVLGVMDTPRPSARRALERLRKLGVTRTIMLTGDNQRVADAVAREVGISEARGDLLPEHKVDAVAELARGGTRVAMVGDGVNDAPALASATIGIAMGAGGSDVALETADIALMSDDLDGLPFAVGLSQACRRVIRQNLWASLGMVAVLIPLTVSGYAGIGLAVALHEGSTLLVVVNALRLLAYRDPGSR